MTLLSNNNLITQSNKLIESKYSLSLSEQRIIFAMISMINPGDEDFREYKIKVSNLAKVIGLKDNNFYSKVQDVTKSILKKTLQIQQKEGILQVNWVSSAQYIDREGIVKLTFDPKLKPYLIQLKENFTTTKFGITNKFKSFYTARIYLLLKQYQKIGERTISVESLKEMFPRYEKYKDIKRRVIIPAHEQICDISDISFNFKEIKLGRSVKEVVFYNISAQAYIPELPLFAPAATDKVDEAQQVHEKYGVDLKVAKRLVKKIKNEEGEGVFKKIFRYIDAELSGGKVNKSSGFVVKCLEDGYYKNVDLFEPDEKVEVIIDPVKLDNSNKFWKGILDSFEKEFDPEVYKKWICHLNFVKKEEDLITLATNGEMGKFYKRWIEEKFLEDIKNIIESSHKKYYNINIIYITK